MKIEKRVKLTDVNEFITCVLCKGYLIDATRITECLHTFCKSCIVQYLEENTTCPVCDTLLHQSHPLLYIALDKKLQAIVYKLVAGLDRSELDRQCKFYDEQQLEYPAQLKEALETYQSNQAAKSASGAGGGVKRANSDSAATAAGASSSGGDAKNGSDQNYHRNDEPIALSLEPLGDLKALTRQFMLCSCHATITHLKKYVASNVYSNIDQYKDLDILCQDEILGKDHTLKFVFVTKWKDKEQPLRLSFRPKLNYFD